MIIRTKEQHNRINALYKKFKTKMWVVGAIFNDMTPSISDAEFKTLIIRHESVMKEAKEISDEMSSINLEVA